MMAFLSVSPGAPILHVIRWCEDFGIKGFNALNVCRSAYHPYCADSLQMFRIGVWLPKKRTCFIESSPSFTIPTLLPGAPILCKAKQCPRIAVASMLPHRAVTCACFPTQTLNPEP